MWRAQSDTRLFAIVVAGLAASAWAAIALIQSQQGASGFSHEALGHAPIEVGGRLAETTAIFLVGWLLMTTAMMLPTTLPLVVLFGMFTRRQGHRGLLLALLVLGYTAVWLTFGATAFVLDLGIHRAVESVPWLERNSWAMLALPLILAGAYQFTPLKYLCLDKCRSPYSFIVEQWRGRRPGLDALHVGLHHGLFCVGCCWSLMLLMFAVSIGSLVWMLGLAIVMGVEKNLAWGRTISAPVGVVLLTAGITVVGMNVAA